MISSEDGTISTYYMHLDTINPELKENSPIAEGTIIGTMGGSGNGKIDAYAIHLHYEIKINGKNIDPVIDDANLIIDPQIYITGISGGVLEEVIVTAESPKLMSIPIITIE